MTAAPSEARFQWVCGNGCGPCNVKREDFEYSRTETLAGALIESKTLPRLVSKCCGSVLMMWDNQADEQIDVNLEPVITPEAIRSAVLHATKHIPQEVS